MSRRAGTGGDYGRAASGDVWGGSVVSRDEVDESYVKWLEEALQDHAHTIERLEHRVRELNNLLFLAALDQYGPTALLPPAPGGGPR